MFRFPSPAGARRTSVLLAGLLFLLSALTLPEAASAQSVADLTERPVALAPSGVAAAGKTTDVTYASSGRTGTYTGLVLRGFAAGAAAEGWIRFAGTNEWHPLYVVFSATSGTFLAAYRGDAVFTDVPFALRFTVPAGDAFALEEAGLFDSRNDDTATGVAGTTQRGAAQGVVVPPHVVRRSTWGAEPFRGTPDPLARPDYHHMTFHHAAGFGARNRAEGMEQVRRIQDFHQNGRGWSDIGYHFVADQAGNVYQGRPFLDEGEAFTEAPALALGAHAGGANTGNIGLCILGCYHPPEGPGCTDVITPAARDSVTTMFAFFAERYGVPPANLMGHRDFGATACPGDNNYVLLPEMRTDVATLLETGNLPEIDATRLVAYPNPFRETTTIRYYLERDGVVRLDVFDLAGRRVAQLVDGFQEGERWYHRTLDAAGLASGTYYYRLQVEGFAGVAYEAARSLVRIR